MGWVGGRRGGRLGCIHGMLESNTTHGLLYCLTVLPACTTYVLLQCLSVLPMDYCTACLCNICTTVMPVSTAYGLSSSCPICSAPLHPTPLPYACMWWVTHTHQGWVGAQPCGDITAASSVALIQGTARLCWAGGAGARLAGVTVGAWVTITAGLAIRLWKTSSGSH